jgi:hypothetical protein
LPFSMYLLTDEHRQMTTRKKRLTSVEILGKSTLGGKR